MDEELEIKEKYLPIGTVVLLNEGNKKLMITSYLIFPTGNDEKKEMYDYGGCLFPEGVIDSKSGIGFNHDQIKEVIHYGNYDEDFDKLNEAMKEVADTLKTEIEKLLKEPKVEV